MPRTSIIIRTFNEEKHIGTLLAALQKQEEQDFETILVDSGSTDETLAIATPQCDHVVQISSCDFTFGYSLNAGARRASGDILVIVSAHAIPTHERWLGSLLAPFQDERVAMVYGRHIGAATTKFSERRDFERHFGPSPVSRHPLPYFTNNANAALRTALWRDRLFDEYLSGLEDIEWARHMTSAGYHVRYVPEASVHHIHDETWPRVYNRYRREAIAARRIGIPAPPLGSPNVSALCFNVIGDCWSSRSEISFVRFQEIILFRYHQWRGTRHGWRYAHTIDIVKERGPLYYASANYSVVVNNARTAEIRETTIPEVKPGDVLIRVAYTGICTTDLEIYDGVLGYYAKGVAQYPITPGHEFSGTVVRIGANVANCRVGDHVVGECILSCRACVHCANGSNTACAARREVGVINYHGSYATFMTLPALYVHRIPSGLDQQKACLAEPLAVVLRGIRRLGSRLTPRSRCAVIGAGPIGNLCAQVLALDGRPVTVFNKTEDRLRYLASRAATRMTLEGLHEFDIVVEATGSVTALETVLRCTRTDATLLLLGFPYGTIPFNFEDVVGQEKVIIGSVGGAAEDFNHALQLLPILDTTPFLQTVFPLREFAKAWEAHRSAKQLKVMLRVGEYV